MTRPEMPTTPLLLTEETCEPARLTSAAVTSSPEERSAFSIERAIDWEAACRSTMVPLRMPCEGSMPTPRMRRAGPWPRSAWPPPSTRATSVQTLVVPISMPTTICSSAMALLLRDALRPKSVIRRIQARYADQAGGNPLRGQVTGEVLVHRIFGLEIAQIGPDI